MPSDILKAARDGNFKMMKGIIYRGWIYPRMVLSRFYEKSNPNIRQNIAEFVGLYGFNIHAIGGSGGTPLLLACENATDSSSKCVALLLRFGADISDTSWYGGDSSLHRACFWGNFKCVELLLRFGADVNTTNDSMETPLHVASYEGRPKCMDILLKNGANINAIDSDGDTPFDLACTEEEDIVLSRYLQDQPL